MRTLLFRLLVTLVMAISLCLSSVASRQTDGVPEDGSSPRVAPIPASLVDGPMTTSTASRPSGTGPTLLSSTSTTTVVAVPESTPTVELKGGTEAMSSLALRRPWSQVHNFVYWIDGPDVAQIAATPYELAVIDYSADASEARAFSPEEIDRLRHTGCERRVLAYLSIGEAEKHRSYWQPGWRPGQPGWLVGENPEWPGDHFIRYWDADWQRLVYQYLDRILAQGFDGVYLDWVLAYSDPHAQGHERDMVDFVLNIAKYARVRSPLGEDFGVFPQNAEELGEKYPEYVAAVTGIGREEVYVEATDRPTSEAERTEAESYLDRFLRGSRARLVLTIDYARRPQLVREAYDRSRSRGYVPYVADVELDRIRVNQGYEPACRPFAGEPE